MATVLDAENTPLVQNSDVYTRFRERTKILIVAQISVCGLLPMFSAESFVPSIPQIARDLETTGAVVNLAVSLSIFTASTGALVWSRYSSFYGRRPIYLYSLPVFAIGSLGTACVRSAPALMFWRVVQAFGASGGFVVGVGVIADVYRLEERGRAMGIFLAAVLLAAPVAPPVGGFVARYYSWRTMQLGLCGAAVLIFMFMLIWMPETSQPGARGIDKIEEGKSRIVVLNPFKELRLLRGLNVLAMCIIATGALMTDFLMLNPLAYTIGKRYGIHSEAAIGLLFVPCGVGNMIGAPIAGRFSDAAIVRGRAKRNGVWVPEDRLHASLFGAGVLVPLSLLAFSLSLTFVPNQSLGITLIVLALFANGIGVDFVLTPVSAYLVDILHDRSAEAMAATGFLRGALVSLFISGILPAHDTFGMFATHVSVTLFAWACFGLLLFTVRYGGAMRKAVDVGYSTAVVN